MKKYNVVVSSLVLACSSFAAGGRSPVGSIHAPAPQPSTNIHPESLQAYIATRLSADYLNHYNHGFQSVCRTYSSLNANQKREVVAVFITGIAKAESGLNSFTKYLEPFGVWSLGLFQTSYEDKGPYGCPYDKGQDKGKSDQSKTVFRSENQIECFLNISKKLYANPSNYAYLRKVAKQRGHNDPAKLSPMDKLSAYWSIFRASNAGGNARFKNYVRANLPKHCL